MGSPARIGRLRPIVLHVSRSAVEALVPRAQLSSNATRFRLVRFSSDMEIGAELGEFIAARLASHGVRKRGVVVALAPDLLETKILELPDLVGKDLEAVVIRRAAALCELDPGDAAFAAVALDGEDAPERRWLVHATPRGPLSAFQTEMRSHGFTVRSVVAARSALFLSGQVVHTDEANEGATLAIVFEEDDCAIGVLDERRLVHLSVVPGGADTHIHDEESARSFVHELRSIDAFWRRKSRGQSVTSVAVGGVAPYVVDRLEPAIRSALGDVPVVALDDQLGVDGQASDGDEGEAVPVGELKPLDEAEERARIAMLDAIGRAKIDALDLSVELSPMPRAIVAVSLLSACAWGLLAQGVRAELHGAATALATETELNIAAASDIERWRVLDDRVRATEGRLRAARDEIVEAAAVGLPTETLVAGLFDAFDRDTALLSVNAIGPALSPMGSAGSVRVRGVVRDEPGRTAVALARFEQKLRALSCVQDVSVEMPNLADRSGDALGNTTSTLRFTATATLAAPEPEEPSSVDPGPGGVDS